MWACPDCGTKFHNTDQQHACGVVPVEDFLAGRPEGGVAVYRILEARLLALPGVDVRGLQTRIHYRTDGVAFASVEKVTRNGVDVSFALREANDHALVKRIFRESGDLKGHTARVASEGDVDALMPLLEDARALQAQD